MASLLVANQGKETSNSFLEAIQREINVLTFLTATFLPCPGGPFTSSGNNMRPEKTEPKAPSPIILPGVKSSVHLLISGKGKETGLPSAKAACIDANICVG